MTVEVRASEVAAALAMTGRHRPLLPSEKPFYVKILRGAHLHCSILDAQPDDRRRRRVIEIARILAMCKRRRHCVAMGRSAGLLHDLDLPDPLGEELGHALSIGTTKGVRERPFHLPAVIFRGTSLASATRVPVHATRLTCGPSEYALGVRAAGLEVTALSAAVLHGGRMGFVVVCEVYRRALQRAGCSHPCTTDADGMRESAIEALDLMEGRMHGTREGRWILAHADPGCESAGESWLLWALASNGVGELCTQHWVRAGDSNCFLDLAIPRILVAIEFDGRFKYGASVREIQQKEDAERRRQRALEEVGWTVFRFRWTDLFDAERLVGQLRALVARHRRGMHRCPRAPSVLRARRARKGRV